MITKSLHPDEKYKAGTLGASMTKAGFGVGILLLLVAAILAFLHKDDDHYRRFQYAYLTAWAFIWTIAVGALFFVLIHHLARARWGTVQRRIAENIAMTMPVIGVLGLGFLLPMLAGNHELYFWSYFHGHPDPHNTHLMAKSGWLAPGFFVVRYLVYMAIYSAIAIYFSKKSRQQDESGDPKLSEQMRIASGPGMLIYSLTTVMAGFDILMSLSPEWYSSIYSVNLFGGACCGFYAFLAILTRAVQKTGRLTRSVNAEHYQDDGKYLFGFLFFWAYTAFSQFMLIWYSNIPEEVIFYRFRMFTDWEYLSWAILIGWAIPYTILLSRWPKRILPAFMVICVWVLVHHYLDLYWNVMPNLHWAVGGGEHGAHVMGPLHGALAEHKFKFDIVDLVLLFSMIAMFIGAIGRQMKGNLIPVKDPNLGASLAFENY